MTDTTLRARTYLVDPPWPEHGGGKSKRGADRHYKLLSPKKILATIRRCPAWDPPENAHLYLWVTNTHLRDGIWLMEELGFTYKTNLAWVKTRRTFDLAELMEIAKLVTSGKVIEALRRVITTGLGQYFRGQHELLLFGVKGKGDHPDLKTPARDVTGVIFAGRGAHSEKPPEAHERIERRSYGPYLELFARRPRSGWAAWGDQLADEEESP